MRSMSGTSFSAAYVSGLAALVRAQYPNLSAAQVIKRIEWTAHSPANVIDNRMGYGTIDPVAALNDDVAFARTVAHRTLDATAGPAGAFPVPRPASHGYRTRRLVGDHRGDRVGGRDPAAGRL